MKLPKEIKLKNGKVTKNELDDLCRKLNKLRNGNACQACGRTEMLQWAHVLSQGAYANIRWEPLNHMLLCFVCHLGNGGWHKDPHKWVRWFDEKWPGRYDRLKYLGQNTYKTDKEAMKLYLLQEIKKAEDQPTITW